MSRGSEGTERLAPSFDFNVLMATVLRTTKYFTLHIYISLISILLASSQVILCCSRILTPGVRTVLYQKMCYGLITTQYYWNEVN